MQVTKLHTVVSQEGDGSLTPLVLLHGFTGDVTTWDPLVAELGQGRTVIAIDLVGHGLSEAPAEPSRYTMTATVAAVRHAVRQTLGGETSGLGTPGGRPAHWLGYSMGGRVALNLALSAPVEAASLVLIGASPGIVDNEARRDRVGADEELARFIEEHGIAAFVDRWMAHPLFATQERLGAEYLARSREQRLRNEPTALANTLRGMGTGAMDPVWDLLAEIDVPVLLVNGELDNKFDSLAVDMSQLMPRAERLVVPEVGHAVHVEAPVALAAAVDGWMVGAGRPGAGRRVESRLCSCQRP